MAAPDVDQVLASMTLEEKCAQLAGTWFSHLVTVQPFRCDQSEA